MIQRFIRCFIRIAIVISVMLAVVLLGLLGVLLFAPEKLLQVLFHGVIGLCFLTAIWICVGPMIGTLPGSGKQKGKRAEV